MITKTPTVDRYSLPRRVTRVPKRVPEVSARDTLQVRGPEKRPHFPGPFSVERTGIEPVTSGLQSRG
jgi:hypothetical protein